MKGCQFARLMYAKPKPMKRKTTVSLMTTMTLLKPADSLMPMMSRMVITATMTIAGTLRTRVPYSTIPR